MWLLSALLSLLMPLHEHALALMVRLSTATGAVMVSVPGEGIQYNENIIIVPLGRRPRQLRSTNSLLKVTSKLNRLTLDRMRLTPSMPFQRRLLKPPTCKRPEMISHKYKWANKKVNKIYPFPEIRARN